MALQSLICSLQKNDSIFDVVLREFEDACFVASQFNHVARSVALHPTAQLDARSVALHFNY